MKIEFIKLEQARNGDWMVTYSQDNGPLDLMWVTPLQALVIQSAQRVARNELRATITEALRIERRDGMRPV